MSQEVVDTVRSWGGRFLEREVDSHGSERHYLMNQAGAIRLVEQKFRDEPNKRKRNRLGRKKTAKKARRRNKDEEEESEISDVESQEQDDEESWCATVEPLDTALLSAGPYLTDPALFSDLSSIHCISPAHSVEANSQLEPLSDEELELEDFVLDDDEINELLSDPYAWGNNFSVGLIADPALFFTDDRLMDMFLDGDDLFDFTS
jgi:hypothetical protein